MKSLGIRSLDALPIAVKEDDMDLVDAVVSVDFVLLCPEGRSAFRFFEGDLSLLNVNVRLRDLVFLGSSCFSSFFWASDLPLKASSCFDAADFAVSLRKAISVLSGDGLSKGDGEKTVLSERTKLAFT